MRLTPRRHNILIVFACLALVPFIRLGEGDLHEDEVIYAARAQQVVAQGNLMPDVALLQMHGRQPPLVIWGMALSFRLFGFSSFAARLVQALSFFVLLVAAYFLACRMMSGRSALGVVALLASSPLLFRFGQLAQLDVPWLALVILALAAFVYGWDMERRGLIVLSGLMFGLSLTAKLFASVLPLAALTIWAIVQWRISPDTVKSPWRSMFLLAGTAIAVALPWFLFMIVRYGTEFTSIAIGYDVIERAVHGADATAKDSGKLFYVNALVVGFPISALVGVFAVYRVRQWIRMRRSHLFPWELFLWIWVVVPFVALTIMHGQLHSYAIQLLPPLAILAFMFIDILMDVQVPATWRVAALGAFVVALGWGVSQTVRDGARQLIVGAARIPVSTSPFLVVFAIIAIVFILIIFVAIFRPRLLHRLLWAMPTYGVAVLLLVRVVDAATDHTTMRITGAQVVAEALPESGPVMLFTQLHGNGTPQRQFQCYDRSQTLYERFVLMDRRDFVAAPQIIDDSIRRVVVEKPDPYMINDSSGMAVGVILRKQQFVSIVRTPLYEVFARGLLRDH